MRPFAFLIICSLVLSSVSAQQLYFNHLSVNNGLTQGVNNCVFRDSRGYVWISSFDGLNRFDGIDCKRYYAVPNDAKGIGGTLFLNILEDKDANLWIGSNEGLNFYSRRSDSFFCFRIGQAAGRDQFCSPFYIDDQQHVWLQSGSDIFTFDPTREKFTRLSPAIAAGSLLIKTIPSKLYQPVRQLYVVSSTAALLWKGEVSNNAIRWTPCRLPVATPGINALQLSGDSAWIGTSDGLYTFSLSDPATTCEPDRRTTGMNISCLHLDAAGTLWMGTVSQGVVRLDAGAAPLKNYAAGAGNNFSLTGNQVINIYTDENRNLWVSVWGKGVDYTNLGKFHFNQYVTRPMVEELGTDNFLRSITETHSGIWCATQSGNLLLLDSAKNIHQVIRGLPAPAEFLLAEEQQVWAATFKGLFAIDATTHAVRRIPLPAAPGSSLASQQYNYITRLQDGSLLLSSNAGLYLAKQKQGSFTCVPVKGANASDVYLTSFADSSGLLYVSKAFKGFALYRLQQDSLITIREFPLQATIKCFTDTPDSLVWIGSTIGLLQFNKKSRQLQRIFTTADGLSNQYVYAVVPDRNYLLLSTNAGINRFDRHNYQVKKFTAADGLQSSEYNTYSFCKTASGEILFGGVNGLNGFDPAALTPSTTAPKLVLSNISLNDTIFKKHIDFASMSSLQVKYEQNTIGLQFTVIDFVNAAAATIRYTLEGYDHGWVQVPNKSFIRYVNLPPGGYVLKVQAFNADGVQASNEYRLLLTVEGPWWQSWWFRLLIFFTSALLVAVAIKFYLREKLQKQKTAMEKELAVEQERIRMARELHDGLGSMLSGIKHSFSAIKNDVDLNPQQKNKFEYTIDKLDDSIKDLRAVSHTMFSAQLLEEGLEAAIRNYCSAMSTTTGTRIVFENIVQQPAGLKGEHAFHIFRVVQELIQNIVKHSGASEAIVQLTYDESMLSITVEDNGIGFNPAAVHQRQGIGLKNIESRIKMLHGKMDIQSQPGKGTSVFIEVPAG